MRGRAEELKLKLAKHTSLCGRISKHNEPESREQDNRSQPKHQIVAYYVKKKKVCK